MSGQLRQFSVGVFHKMLDTQGVGGHRVTGAVIWWTAHVIVVTVVVIIVVVVGQRRAGAITQVRHLCDFGLLWG